MFITTEDVEEQVRVLIPEVTEYLEIFIVKIFP